MNIVQKLLSIQMELKAPKNQFNKFGNYKYRSAEDILESVKPLTKKYNVVLKITDSLKELAGKVYVESTAKLIDCEDVDTQIESTAQAIIDFNAKGMQDPQRTGSASSYAKKYALGDLFLLDDTKDSDATNTHNKVQKKSTDNRTLLETNSDSFVKVAKYLEKGGDIETVKKKYKVSLAVENELLNNK
jgi:hypothetical protein|tara:strand:- start:9313 stop:9876 length:564 start_codon:yes stop_codon:yes gene_type:complete